MSSLEERLKQLKQLKVEIKVDHEAFKKFRSDIEAASERPSQKRQRSHGSGGEGSGSENGSDNDGSSSSASANARSLGSGILAALFGHGGSAGGAAGSSFGTEGRM